MHHLVVAAALILTVIGAQAALIAKVAGIDFFSTAGTLLAVLTVYGLGAYPVIRWLSRRRQAKPGH